MPKYINVERLLEGGYFGEFGDVVSEAIYDDEGEKVLEYIANFPSIDIPTGVAIVLTEDGSVCEVKG